jgi:subtilisin family serine protease
VRATLLRLRGEAVLRAGQPNYVYRGAHSPQAQRTGAATAPEPVSVARPAVGDPAQYALAKLRLTEAHTLADGGGIVVAVIDSGIDLDHPELQGVAAGFHDTLDRPGRPHAHGTGIAGAIAAHARLLGAAPAARILAIRAFGDDGGDKSTTFAILKGLELAASRRARIVNMSFAGPPDPGLSRQLAAARRKGQVLVAAAGNSGPDAPPQFPAADPSVIAVAATDARDLAVHASSAGPHIAVAAPGADLLLPAPNGDYQLASGTSYAAAYVSGIAALILQRAPELSPAAVRQILESTARDLGPRGKDRRYGAGLVDAFRAVTAVEARAAAVPAEPRR